MDAFDINIQTSDAILGIAQVTQAGGECQAGRETDLTIIVENHADSVLKDIKLNLELIRTTTTATSVTYEEMPFSTLGSSNEMVIDELEPGARKAVTFSLIADADAASDVYKIKLNMDNEITGDAES